IVSLDVPDSYIELLNKISLCICTSRSEVLRLAIREYLIREMATAQKLEKEVEELKIVHIFDYCINCEKKLDSLTGLNHKFNRNFKVFELKFCCSCYTKFRDKSLDEFPAYLINRIKKNVKAYKSYKEKSNKSDSNM
ncbi:MAG: ribbon-helix-helix domain-containing protein, partial [Promethearchaeota archaeon]